MARFQEIGDLWLGVVKDFIKIERAKKICVDLLDTLMQRETKLL